MHGMHSPFIAACLLLALLWILWLTDFRPHVSIANQNKSNPGVESWIPNLNGKPEADRLSSVSSGISNGNDVTTPSNHQQRKSRPLIVFAFFETPASLLNLEFFLKHGLHDAADFLFVINGNSTAASIIPVRPNVRHISRKNECYDLGAVAEVLIKDDLYKKYDRFITMNASIRGPFLPAWSTGCWSDMFLDRVTDKVKLVGTTLGCRPHGHVQSMIWATDRVGMETLLFPSEALISKFKSDLPPHDSSSPVPAYETVGINACPKEYWKAVALEVFATPLLRSAGYEIDVLMAAYHGIIDYEQECRRFMDGDMLSQGHYWGMDLHPFDTIFAKTNRQNNPLTLDMMTHWTDRSNYSSYDHCHL